jgi:hypothetical protein
MSSSTHDKNKSKKRNDQTRKKRHDQKLLSSPDEYGKIEANNNNLEPVPVPEQMQLDNNNELALDEKKKSKKRKEIKGNDRDSILSSTHKKLKQDIQETTGDDDNHGRKAPEVNEAFYQSLARIAFAREYFYFDDTTSEKNLTKAEIEARWKVARKRVSLYVRIRKIEFKNDSVQVVLSRKEDLKELFTKAGISAFKKKIQPLIPGLSNEEKLAKKQIIALNADAEVRNYKEQYVSLDDSVTRKRIALDALKPLSASKRSMPLIFVLGSSGSGKTFAALELGSSYKLYSSEQLKSTTLYLNAAVFVKEESPKYDTTTNDDPATQREKWQGKLVRKLVKWINKGIKKNLHTPNSEVEVLNMHVSVIIDEAGSPALQGTFENLQNVSKLVAKLVRIASSLLVIITGTGVDATVFSSEETCNKVRLTAWTKTDLYKVMEKKGLAFEKDTLQNMADAIKLQPTLDALSTNARSASYLLDFVKQMGGGLDVPKTVSEWVLRFDGMKQTFVSYVVDQYAKNNSIKRLETQEKRRRVAASVLHFLSAYMKNHLEKPPFIGLEDLDEKVCAPALIDLNIESTSTGEVKYARAGTNVPVIMTPALVIVVCAMLGVKTELLSNFESQEVVTALYALSQQVSTIMETYHKEDPQGNDAAARAALNKKLSQLSVCRLTKHVPFQRKDCLTMNIPKVTPQTIWLNAPRTPGPDIVAHKLLGQAKYSEVGDVVSINAWEELAKCGLLKHQLHHFGKVALQYYFGIWQGAYKKAENGQPRKRRNVPFGIQSQSKAYPFNMLDTSSEETNITYLEVKRNTKDKKTPWIYTADDEKETDDDDDDKVTKDADKDDDEKVTFLFSTNAKTIKLTGQLVNIGVGVKPETFSNFTFKEQELDDAGQLDVDKLTDGRPQQWEKFIKHIDTNKVDLKFLFTRS